MKKAIAIACIVFFSLGLIASLRNFQQNPIPPGDYAALTRRLAAIVLLIGFLFFSVRWYLTLDGHNYRVNSQAWASILMWYSFLGVLMGIMLTINFSHIGGGIFLLVWILIAWACCRWRNKLRNTERGLSAQASSPMARTSVKGY